MNDLNEIRRNKAKDLWYYLEMFGGKLSLTEIEYANPALLNDLLDAKEFLDNEKQKQINRSAGLNAQK